MTTAGIGKADLHMHTCHDGWGDGNDTVVQIFDHAQNQTDLDVIGLTDHDSTEAARAGQKLHAAGGFRFDFLPGVEATTTSGHVLCYFPGEIYDVPSLRSLLWTTTYVHDRGGVCILAHPVYPPWLRRSVLKPHSRTVRMVDAIEVINGGLSEGAQSKLDEIGVALSDRYATVGNSDSHHKASIGSVFTTFPGHTASDYLAALQARSTCPSRGEAVAMPRDARAFTRRRSMTRPGWVRNVYREVAGRPK